MISFRKSWKYKTRLIWRLKGSSKNQYLSWSQFIHQNWKQTFEQKLVYIIAITVQDMVLDSYFRQIVSGQVTSSTTSLMLFFQAICHFFLQFLLLTLNMFFLGWIYSEQSYITATCWLTETKFHPNILLGFSAEPIRMHVNSLQV